MIPEAAVEAALSAYYDRGGLNFASSHPSTRTLEMEDMRAALEAAAPYMEGPLRDILAMCDKADNDPGSMYGKLTTWEIRQALGANNE